MGVWRKRRWSCDGDGRRETGDQRPEKQQFGNILVSVIYVCIGGWRMKYTSVDELIHFQFHDAKIQKIDYNGMNMIWEASLVNVTTGNTQNQFSNDMCTNFSVIVFENCHIESIVFGASEAYQNGVLVASCEAVTAIPKEYESILDKTPCGYCYIFGMDSLSDGKDGRYRSVFDITGGAGSYYLTLSFTKSIISWDEYSGLAWYEDPKWKQ